MPQQLYIDNSDEEELASREADGGERRSRPHQQEQEPRPLGLSRNH